MENIRSFEFTGGQSKKFWVIVWEERSIRIWSGEGEASTGGYFRSINLRGEISCLDKVNSFIKKKIDEGYKEVEWTGWDNFRGRTEIQQETDDKAVNARKKYWENYHPLRQKWIKLIEQAQEVAFEKYGTRKLSVYIATKQNRLVFYALIPGEKKGKFLYRCDGGSLMKEQVDLLKIFCVDYLEVQTNWREDLGCTHARISTDFDVTI